MSYVSGVLLMVSVCEDGPEDGIPVLVNGLNQWLVTSGHAALADLTEHARVRKHPQCFMFGAGFNYFPEDDFAAFVLAQPWELPENVVLLIQPEEGPTRVWRPPQT